MTNLTSYYSSDTKSSVPFFSPAGRVLACRRLPGAAPLRAILFVALFLPCLLAPAAPADETIYLRSGEEFQGTLSEITKDAVRASIRGEERSWPLNDIQRIEFQRPREFDGLDTPDALSAASSLFRDALAVPTDELKKKYPQAGYVILRSDLVITVSADLKCRSERTLVWRILEQRAADSAFEGLSFFPDSQTAEVLYAVTVAPDGKVSRLADSSVKVESVHAGLAEYDYLKRMRFSLKNPVPGATLFLKTRMTATASVLSPIVSDSVLFGSEPMVEGTVTLVADPEALKNVGLATSGLKTPEDALVWRVTDAPQIMPEPLMPPLASFAPRVLIACPSSTWAKLAFEFHSAAKFARITSEEGTTAADVYDRVRRDIRTIGVSQQDLSRPPSPPDVVLKRGFGNEVEKALLLEALLDGLGLQAHTVLVWGRSGGPLLAEVPRLRGYDHALVRFINPDSTETWLVADDRLAAFGEIPADAEGAEGLDLTAGRIVTVPARGRDSDCVKRTVDVTLAADGGAVVNDTYTLRGRAARRFRGIWDMTDQQARNWATNAVCADVTGTDLIEWKHSDFEKANPEETVSFSYRIPNLARVAGDFLILNLPNARYSPTDVGRPTRRYGLFWLGSEESETTFAVHAPEGYSVYAARDAVAMEGQGWRLNVDFERSDEGRSIAFKEFWSRTAAQADPDAYQPYRQALMARGILRKEMLVFRKQAP